MSKPSFSDLHFVDRRNSDSQKWDALKRKYGRDDLLSLWVADMDFTTPAEVKTALSDRMENGIFGYYETPDSYFTHYNRWMESHYNYPTPKEKIRFIPGIVTAIYWFISAFSQARDSVIIMTPVYYPFHNAVKDLNRTLITMDFDYTKGVFSMDYEKFEQSIIDNGVKLFILCSPHNPVGKVWTEAELDRILDICQRNKVLVFSDEIHQDITFKGNRHTPSAIVHQGKYKDMIITANSVSKTFNLAAFNHANLIIENPKIMKTYDAYVNEVYRSEPNLVGIMAAEAAYQHGESWRQNMLATVYDNYQLFKSQMADYPQAYIAELEGTYLMFVDLRAYVDQDDLYDFTVNRCKLACDFGEWFGDNWKGFIRINLSTKPAYIKEAANRIKRELEAITQ